MCFLLVLVGATYEHEETLRLEEHVSSVRKASAYIPLDLGGRELVATSKRLRLCHRRTWF